MKIQGTEEKGRVVSPQTELPTFHSVYSNVSHFFTQ